MRAKIETDAEKVIKIVWNAAIEKAAKLAYQCCCSDIYVREVGLEKIIAKKIRRLKKK